MQAWLTSQIAIFVHAFWPICDRSGPSRSCTLRQALIAHDMQQFFRADMSARTVWRTVQTQRLVIAALKSNESGIRKDFFVSCKWMVLSLIFVRLRPQWGEALSLTAEESNKITTAAQNYAEQLWTVCKEKGFVTAKATGGWEVQRHFRSVFCSVVDCQRLYGAVQQKLADVELREAALDTKK